MKITFNERKLHKVKQMFSDKTNFINESNEDLLWKTTLNYYKLIVSVTSQGHVHKTTTHPAGSV
jgi:hypothetical protein